MSTYCQKKQDADRNIYSIFIIVLFVRIFTDFTMGCCVSKGPGKYEDYDVSFHCAGVLLFCSFLNNLFSHSIWTTMTILANPSSG